MFKFLFELTVIIHFLWILFLIFGSLIGVKYKIIKYFHIFGLGFAVFLQIFNLNCPLTILENYFRKKAGIKIYEETFISYYLQKIIYVAVEPVIIFILTIILVILHLFIYSKFGEVRR